MKICRSCGKGNVIVISMRANAIKYNATPEEILKVGTFFSNLLHSKAS